MELRLLCIARFDVTASGGPFAVLLTPQRVAQLNRASGWCWKQPRKPTKNTLAGRRTAAPPRQGDKISLPLGCVRG
jgi:hypothetical protein